MKNKKTLIIIGSLVIGGILLLSVGKRLGWFGGVKPIEVEVKEATKGKITELLKIFHSLNQKDQEWVVTILPRILEIKEDDRQHQPRSLQR